jgi:serine/threonine-protein kinase
MELRRVGRYLLAERIGSGGMATVHLGRLVADGGFKRTVAIKRLHGHLADRPDLVRALLDEAQIVARIHHPNVVPTLDVVSERGEVLLVMEYVHGETLSTLVRLGGAVPPRIAVGIVVDVLRGLHAAHEAKSEAGEPLGIVHRDVSPQNVLVGADGVGRVLDFGIAKAEGRSGVTRPGQVKGKLAYMAPEQLLQGVVSRRTDCFAAGIVLWEALTGKRLYEARDLLEGLDLESAPSRPSSLLSGPLPAALDDIVLKAIARDPADRFRNAEEFATALEEQIRVANTNEIAHHVSRVAGNRLAERTLAIAALERAGKTPVSKAGIASARLASGTTPATEEERSTKTDVSTDAVQPKQQRRRIGIAIVFSALIVLSLPMALALVRASPVQALGPASVSPPLGTPTASAGPRSESVTATASARSDLPPGLTVVATTEESRAHVAKAAPSRLARPPRAVPASVRASDRCSPPDYWDGDAGIRRLKRECL